MFDARPSEDRDLLVTVLPAVAVRAHEGMVAPQLGEARHVRDAVAHPARDQDAPGGDRVAAGERDEEGARGLDAGHGAGPQLDRRQLGQLVATGCVELGWARAVLAEEAADRGCVAVAGIAGVHDEGSHARPPEHERGGEAGSRAAHDKGFEVGFHAPQDDGPRLF